MSKNKEGSFTPIIIIMFVSLLIAGLWNSFPVIKNSVHAVLDPSAGVLLNWNLTWGMLIIVLIIALGTTIIQKYTTNQEALKELKEAQKVLQEEMRKFQKEGNTAKIMELQKQQFEFMPKMMKLSMASVVYTGIPFILFFRWFNDYFNVIEEATGVPVRFLGFLSWFWFYLIFTMIFSGFIRKWMKVA